MQATFTGKIQQKVMKSINNYVNKTFTTWDVYESVNLGYSRLAFLQRGKCMSPWRRPGAGHLHVTSISACMRNLEKRGIVVRVGEFKKEGWIIWSLK